MSLAMKYKMKKRACHGGKMAEGGKASTRSMDDFDESMDPKDYEEYKERNPRPHERGVSHVTGHSKESRKAILEQARSIPKPKLPMAEGGEARYKADEGMSKQGRYVRESNFQKDQGYNEDSEGYPYMDRAKDEAHKNMMKESMRENKFPKHFADGGEVDGCPTCGAKQNMEAMHEDDMDFNQHGDSDMGPGGDNGLSPVVHKIMMGRKQGFSEGGKVANKDEPMADFEENSFDDLANRDDLEFHDTAENSGDELGDEREDMDRKDVVSKIMASRKKKDRNPRPA